MSDQKNINILIIEDDLIIAQNIKEYLVDFGYGEIKIAKNYQDTLQIHKSFTRKGLCANNVGLLGRRG